MLSAWRWSLAGWRTLSLGVDMPIEEYQKAIDDLAARCPGVIVHPLAEHQ